MLKKVLIAFATLFVLLIAAVIVLPIIFKDEIVAIAQEQANANLNATVALGDFDLSLWEQFPDFTLTISNVSITGKEPFESVVLADIAELKISLDLMSVLGGEHFEINTVGLLEPKLHVIVLPDGRANYDITIPSEEEETPAEEPSSDEGEGSSFSLGLHDYYIRNATVIYDDRPGGMYAELQNFTHEGSGDFTQDVFDLSTYTTADEVTYRQDGVSYLSRTKLDMKFDLNMDMPNARYTFGENHVQLNALHLGFEGWVAMPETEGEEAPIDMDLRFETRETTFKSILSLIPAIYLTDFEDVETAGTLALNGFAKGRMVGESLPAFEVNLSVDDARFQYPDLPKSAEAISINLQMQNSGGSDDNTIIDLHKFHVELAGNPVDIVMHMRTPISDPFIDAHIDMNLDMASLADVVPLEEGQKITGVVQSDIALKGHQSALDQERYDDFEASGALTLTNFDYTDPAMPYNTLIERCSLQFSPQFAQLSAFDMKLGQSDVSMVGRVDNIVAWYVADAPLSGTFDLRSDFLNIDELSGPEAESEEAAATTDAEEMESGVVEVPAGYDFRLSTSIARVVYDGLEIKSLTGQVLLKDQKLDMRSLQMSMLGGSLSLSGSYETVNPVQPGFDVDMQVSNWDIQQTYTYLDLAKKMAPVMANSQGSFSTGLILSGAMDQNMDPRLETLNGKGKLKTNSVKMNQPAALVKAAEALKYDGLKNLDLDNVHVSFSIKDGRLTVEPVSTIIGKEIPAVLTGSHGLDGTLDYVLNLDIPTRLMGSAATQAVGSLMSQVSKATGVNASLPERVQVDLDITGTTEDPTVKPRMAGTTGGSDPVDDLKGMAEDELNRQKDELEAKAQQEADKAKAEAEARAKAEADKAKAQADAAAKKAEEDARKKLEAEKQKAAAEAKKKEEEAKRKAEEEAKKKLKGLVK